MSRPFFINEKAVGLKNQWGEFRIKTARSTYIE